MDICIPSFLLHVMNQKDAVAIDSTLRSRLEEKVIHYEDSLSDAR